MISKKFHYVIIFATVCVFGNGELSHPQDTYLSALENSHQKDPDGKNGGYNYQLIPTAESQTYGPPSPPVSYGPPSIAYGPPAKPVYPAINYEPPQFYYSPSFQPRDHWLWHKLKSKLSLFTIGKIILKLLIFKKMIKFIGIICLLLFLPKLKNMFKDNMMNNDEDGKDRKKIITEKDILEKRIDELSKVLTDVFELD